MLGYLFYFILFYFILFYFILFFISKLFPDNVFKRNTLLLPKREEFLIYPQALSEKVTFNRHRHESGKRVQQIKMLLSTLMTDIPSPGLTWQKESTNYYEISDFHLCPVSCANLQTHIQREKREMGVWEGKGEERISINVIKKRNKTFRNKPTNQPTTTTKPNPNQTNPNQTKTRSGHQGNGPFCCVWSVTQLLIAIMLSYILRELVIFC